MKECENCGGEMKAGSNYKEGNEQVCFMVCKECGEIDEESITYG